MALLRQDLFNSPYVGVFCAVSDALALLPPGIPANDRAAISEALGAPVIEATVGGSRVLGTLVAMNSQGLLVSNLATGRERIALAAVAEKHGLRFGVLEEGAHADLLVLRVPDAWRDEHLIGRLIYSWSSRLIEARVVPMMKDYQYLGFDLDFGSGIYTLKFLRDGNVVWVEVDGHNGQVLGRTGN